MTIRGFRKYTMNPALGLLPIGIFIFLNANSLDLFLSVSIAAFLGLALDLFFHYVIKTVVFWMITVISIAPLIFTSLFALFSPINIEIQHNYMIICEIWLVLTLFVLRETKKYTISYYCKRVSIQEKNLLQDIFSTISLTEHLFTLHLFVVLAYSFLIQSYGVEGWDFFVYILSPIAIIIGIICFESYIIRSLIARIFKEEWLPIVNEKGWVTGKVAKSVSLKMKNKYLHPVIRIALICNKTVYLQQRPKDAAFEPEMWDHPFEKFMLFKHEPNQSVCNCISKQFGEEPLEHNFQFKYIFENSETKRLILFYISKIDSPEDLKGGCHLKGKFWTVKQIEAELHSNIFSECFLHEYEYLKTTLLNPVLAEIN